MGRDDGIAIAELRSIFHLDTYLGQLLDEVAAYEAGMPRGAASHKDDVIGIKQLFLILKYATKTHRVMFGEQTTAHGVAHDGGLFVDLLHHEMVEARLLDRVEVHLQLLHVGHGFHVMNGLDVKLFAQLDAYHLLILKVDHLLSATHDRRGIGGDIILVFAYADDHGAAFTGGDEFVGVTFFHNGDGIGAHHVVQGNAHGLKQIDTLALLHVFDEVGEHLRVGRRQELKPTFFQFLAEAQIVLNDAIMDQCEIARL